MASRTRQQIRLDNLMYIDHDYKIIGIWNCWVGDINLDSFRANNHVVDTSYGRGGHPGRSDRRHIARYSQMLWVVTVFEVHTR